MGVQKQASDCKARSEMIGMVKAPLAPKLSFNSLQRGSLTTDSWAESHEGLNQFPTCVRVHVSLSTSPILHIILYYLAFLVDLTTNHNTLSSSKWATNVFHQVYCCLEPSNFLDQFSLTGLFPSLAVNISTVLILLLTTCVSLVSLSGLIGSKGASFSHQGGATELSWVSLHCLLSALCENGLSLLSYSSSALSRFWSSAHLQ